MSYDREIIEKIYARELFYSLRERYQKITYNYYIVGLNVGEIAKIENVTSSRVSYLRKRILRNLKRMAQEDDPKHSR